MLSTTWIIIGFIGQAFFSMRFIVQWICSEKRRLSYIPLAFWYFSILGGLVLLSYAIHKRDPVFIVGQAFGVLVYTRNLYFIYINRKRVKNV
ncbi:MAG: lipid-A-disaccharide synthase N-terminal domain-containing protein [Pseudomonadota bacterium]